MAEVTPLAALRYRPENLIREGVAQTRLPEWTGRLYGNFTIVVHVCSTLE